MTNARMHGDKIETSSSLVQRLICAQFPQWGDLPVTPVVSSGTDNAIYRLGDELAVRLPRRPGAVVQVEKQQQWEPHLAPHLPLRIPLAVAKGAPGEGYPWPWSVYPWLPGEPADPALIGNSAEAAQTLAHFIRALQAIDCSGGPGPGAHNSHRGGPLAHRDAYFREKLAQCDSHVDVEAAIEVWEQALAAPAWDGPPVWIHGDLLPSNLLIQDGRLIAVIDFGMLGTGDPACDLLPAWAHFDSDARTALRAELEVDNNTCERGRGWALSWAVIALPYYLDTNPDMVAMATYALRGLGLAR